jgi:aspartyl/glutamyl-tRNA(Asn/Gln) amidotransferase C subunit
VTVLDLQNVLREDIPSKTVTRDELMKNAPAEYDGYFQVPKTLE